MVFWFRMLMITDNKARKDCFCFHLDLKKANQAIFVSLLWESKFLFRVQYPLFISLWKFQSTSVTWIIQFCFHFFVWLLSDLNFNKFFRLSEMIFFSRLISSNRIRQFFISQQKVLFAHLFILFFSSQTDSTFSKFICKFVCSAHAQINRKLLEPHEKELIVLFLWSDHSLSAFVGN